MGAMVDSPPEGDVVRRAGIMAVVILGGVVKVGDSISSSAPPGHPTALKPV